MGPVIRCKVLAAKETHSEQWLAKWERLKIDLWKQQGWKVTRELNADLT